MSRMKSAIASGAVLIAVFTAPVSAGEIKIGGTGAAYAVSRLLGDAFTAAHPDETVEVIPSMGSSGGIQAVSAGALQVSFSGRPLKADEKAQGLQEMPFVDTPYVFVSSHPKPQKLSTSDVVAIYTGTLPKWPDGKDISPILRPKGDSDTGYLIETIQGMGPALEKLRQRSDVPIAGTDQDNMEAAQKTLNSFTGSTLLQVVSERPRVKIVNLDGLAPSVEAMEKGDYPLKRRLYLVAKANSSPSAEKFILFLRSPDAAKIIRDNGGVLVSAKTASAQ